MPFSTETLTRLAEATAPVIGFLVMRVAVALPPTPPNQIAAVASWWGSLDQAQTRALVAALPPSDLVLRAQRELDPPPPPVPALPVDPTRDATGIPLQPGLETLRGDPHVDRDPIWVGLALLRQTERRILLVNGESKHGKSRAVDLTKMFVADDRERAHKVIDVDLEGMTFDSAMREVFMSFDDEVVPPRNLANAPDEPWLRLVAKAAHKRALALAGSPIVWFVFDHVERLTEFSLHVAFFNRLTELVVESRRESNAPRVVLIDRREVAVHRDLKWPVQISPLTQGEVAGFLQRRDPAKSPEAALAEADVRMRVAQEQAQAARRPAMYMDYLKKGLQL